MREILLSALKSYYVGNINKHIENVEVYLRTSVALESILTYKDQ